MSEGNRPVIYVVLIAQTIPIAMLFAIDLWLMNLLHITAFSRSEKTEKQEETLIIRVINGCKIQHNPIYITTTQDQVKNKYMQIA